MYYPRLKELDAKSETRRSFGGYTHISAVPDGSFYDMLNLSSDKFPSLSVRPKRGVWLHMNYDENGNMTDFDGLRIFFGGGITAAAEINGKLCFAGEYSLYAGGLELENCTLTPPSGARSLVGFGRNIFVAPDGKYIEFTDSGTVIHSASASFSGYTVISSAFLSGESAEEYFAYSSAAPAEGDKKAAYEGGRSYLFTYSAGAWLRGEQIYRRLAAEGIENGFEKGDRVSVTGVNGGDFDIAKSETGALYLDAPAGCTGNADISVTKNMPLLDFAVEHSGRVWGCRFGENENGEFVNEIYASALGNPCVWRRYDGISTDSYCAALSCAGEFTGAAVLGDDVIFFKEDRIIKVSGSTPSDFYISVIPARGVEKGAHNSIACINERLYYKHRDGIMEFDGVQPRCVSEALGRVSYKAQAGGSVNGKYYIAMSDENEKSSIFVYDTLRGLWHREDDEYPAKFFVSLNNCLYSVNLYRSAEEPQKYRAYCFYIHDAETAGQAVDIFSDGGEGVYKYGSEQPREWFAESGVIAANEPQSLILRRLVFRLALSEGAVFRVHVKTDSGEWRLCYESGAQLNGSFSVPILLPRCDSFRLRFSGRGGCEIYSLTRIFEKTGDVSSIG